MKQYFLTFSNTGYMSTERILRQAKELNVFDTLWNKSEKDILEYIEAHQEFIKMFPQGYGGWIWKPKIILDALNTIDEGDLLVYADAGMYINAQGRKRYLEYLSKLEETKHLCVFSLNDSYKAQFYVKNDAIQNYYPSFLNESTNCCYAGIMILKKHPITLQLIREWYELCQCYYYLDPFPSRFSQEHSRFHGNDFDNGLFNLCLFKFKDSIVRIYPDETNLYVNGSQVAHCKLHPSEVDWSSLDEMPFQCRRMTPKNGFS